MGDGPFVDYPQILTSLDQAGLVVTPKYSEPAGTFQTSLWGAECRGVPESGLLFSLSLPSSLVGRRVACPEALSILLEGAIGYGGAHLFHEPQHEPEVVDGGKAVR